MKVLLLNSADNWGGAAKAAFRLHRGLRQQGVQAKLLVQRQERAAAEGVLGPGTGPRLSRLVNGLREIIDSWPVRFYPRKPLYNFTPAFLPERLAARVKGLAPEIIHLHYLAAGFSRLETLRNFKQPLVWTLHDSWAFTGGCHVPFACTRYRQQCGACPLLGSSRERDLSRWIWGRKKKAWQDLKLTVVAPSRWLADCAAASALFRHLRVEVIPNGLDLTIFKPMAKELARKQLALPQDKKLILFGAVGSTQDKNKGFHLLQPALREISAAGWRRNAELVIFGAEAPDGGDTFGLKTHYLGWFGDDAALALLYAAADLFVAPSMLENLPNTVMEAMACGTPCLAFAQGGLADLIAHEWNGYLARPYEAADLAAGLSRLLADDEGRRQMAARARQHVEEKFELAGVARQYAALYHELLAGCKTRESRP